MLTQLPGWHPPVPSAARLPPSLLTQPVRLYRDLPVQVDRESALGLLSPFQHLLIRGEACCQGKVCSRVVCLLRRTWTMIEGVEVLTGRHEVPQDLIDDLLLQVCIAADAEAMR